MPKKVLSMQLKGPIILAPPRYLFGSVIRSTNLIWSWNKKSMLFLGRYFMRYWIHPRYLCGIFVLCTVCGPDNKAWISLMHADVRPHKMLNTTIFSSSTIKLPRPFMFVVPYIYHDTQEIHSERTFQTNNSRQHILDNNRFKSRSTKHHRHITSPHHIVMHHDLGPQPPITMHIYTSFI